jgi:hypothetical protein
MYDDDAMVAPDGLPVPPELDFRVDPVRAVENYRRYWDAGYYELDVEASRKATEAAEERNKARPVGGVFDPVTGAVTPRSALPGSSKVSSFRIRPEALRAIREGREYAPAPGTPPPGPCSITADVVEMMRRRASDDGGADE